MSKLFYNTRQLKDVSHTFAYPLDFFQSFLDENKTEIELQLVEESKYTATCTKLSTDDIFVAHEIDGHHCSNEFCKKYETKNGKKGRCIHFDFAYTNTGQYFTLTKNGLKPCLPEIMK